MNKHWYKSKTLIINILVVVGSIYSGITGNSWMDGETQLIVLSVIGAILRRFTNSGLTK